MNIHTKGFIVSALIYFFIGCSLGIVSVFVPTMMPLIRPVHLHLNLLGWVSMMIMGVSYFVIPVFIRKNPFSDKALTLHLILANVGIIGMSACFAIQNYDLLPVFAVIEVFSVYLFLFNIVATAIKGIPVESSPREWDFLTGEADKEVDRWASYFTQAATLYFVVACSLGAYISLSASGWSYLKVHFHLNLVGWVTLMIYGVAYHIFPRFSSRDVKNGALVGKHFILANLGIVLMTGALIYAEKGDNEFAAFYMLILAGLIEGISGAVFVYNILPAINSAKEIMGQASVRFARASLLYLVLGITLGILISIDGDLASKFRPVHSHLHVLGWITMMIYGVGLYIVPAFNGKKLHSRIIAELQFWIANVGLIGFLLLYPLTTLKGWAGVFAVFELLAALLFIYNMARTIFGPSTQK
ncbi:MAG: hypothetical protein RQ824_03440 [bacterium]|nr:hypothetical protein [bacterium]